VRDDLRLRNCRGGADPSSIHWGGPSIQRTRPLRSSAGPSAPRVLDSTAVRPRPRMRGFGTWWPVGRRRAGAFRVAFHVPLGWHRPDIVLDGSEHLGQESFGCRLLPRVKAADGAIRALDGGLPKRFLHWAPSWSGNPRPPWFPFLAVPARRRTPWLPRRTPRRCPLDFVALAGPSYPH
jgi:hypothetical protein